MEYKGKIMRVISDKGDWSCIKVKLKEGKTLTASGKISNPIEGAEIIIEGDIIVHPTYGEQIKAARGEMVDVMSSVQGIQGFLGSGLIKGVGKATARKIVSKFGKKSIEIIKNNPMRLTEISGISKKKVEKISSSYNENIKYFDLFYELKGDVTVNQAKKIYDKYGEKSVAIVRKNPYVLIYELDGFGFMKADAIARASGVKEDSKDRIGAALIYTLQQISETQGHCYGTLGIIQDDLIGLLLSKPNFLEKKAYNKLISIANDWDDKGDKFKSKYTENEASVIDIWIEKREHLIDLIADVILIESNKGNVITEDEKLYEKSLLFDEMNCAKLLSELTKSKPCKIINESTIEKAIKNIEVTEGYDLEEEQKYAISFCSTHRLSVITGGPGRGKTTIIKGILDSWGNDNVFLCAPTGKAAQRMKETTGREAKTSHRMVVGKPPQGGLLVIDECSMVDIRMASKLLTFGKHCNIIFVGDKDQLLSIGPGSFFKDLVDSPVIPTVKLIKGHRNSGSIARNAEAINEGKKLDDYHMDDKFQFIPAKKENIQEIILNKYLELCEKYEKSEICVLSPMRQRSNSGTNILNKLIRDTVNPLNPSSNCIEDVDFRIGDRVMQLKNMTNKEVYDEHGNGSLGVFNGDCGEVIDIDPEDDILTILFDDGRYVKYEKFETECLTLAYATTIHKSQGSEYKAVMLIHSTEHFFMLRRNLLYTGATRAKEVVFLIGDESAFNDAVTNKAARIFSDIKRNTMLQERISLAM